MLHRIENDITDKKMIWFGDLNIIKLPEFPKSPAPTHSTRLCINMRVTTIKPYWTALCRAATYSFMAIGGFRKRSKPFSQIANRSHSNNQRGIALCFFHNVWGTSHNAWRTFKAPTPHPQIEGYCSDSLPKVFDPCDEWRNVEGDCH